MKNNEITTQSLAFKSGLIIGHIIVFCVYLFIICFATSGNIISTYGNLEIPEPATYLVPIFFSSVIIWTIFQCLLTLIVRVFKLEKQEADYDVLKRFKLYGIFAVCIFNYAASMAFVPCL